MYSPIAMEVHTVSDLQWKQWPDETLQEYIQNIQNFTDVSHREGHGCWPS